MRAVGSSRVSFAPKPNSVRQRAWEGTFPFPFPFPSASALPLTAQCHSRTDVFTPSTVVKPARREPARSKSGAARFAPLSAGGRCRCRCLCPTVVSLLFFFFFLPPRRDQSPPFAPFPFPPPLGRLTTRRADVRREERGGSTEAPARRATCAGVKRPTRRRRRLRRLFTIRRLCCSFFSCSQVSVKTGFFFCE